MIFLKDSTRLLEDVSESSIHAVVSDPPYGMCIMQNNWDKILPPIDIWHNCFRVMRPGAFLVAFGHVRFFHRLVCQLEDCGFVIRDCLCWGYACGNPRPFNADKAVDRHMGIEVDTSVYPYQPVTPEAQTWKGYANMLKPAWEPICLAQKPLEGTMAENLLKWKCGALNIDECRIPYSSEEDRKSLESFVNFEATDHGDSRYFSANRGGKKQANVHPEGRWPANLLWLDPLFAHYDRFFMIPKPSRGEKGDFNTHDTVKPVRLMERLIALVTPKPSAIKEDVVVLDPFAGSGTTGVACKRLGRKFIGYECDEESFLIAQKRLAARVERFDLFER